MEVERHSQSRRPLQEEGIWFQRLPARSRLPTSSASLSAQQQVRLPLSLSHTLTHTFSSSTIVTISFFTYLLNTVQVT